MLDINDISHLKLLYDKFRKTNEYIKKLVLDQDWEGLAAAIENKETLLNQILQFEKPRINEIKANVELINIRKYLLSLEKENIELVKSIKKQLIYEMKNVSNARKIINAYAPETSSTVSTFDIIQD